MHSDVRRALRWGLGEPREGFWEETPLPEMGWRAPFHNSARAYGSRAAGYVCIYIYIFIQVGFVQTAALGAFEQGGIQRNCGAFVDIGFSSPL